MKLVIAVIQPEKLTEVKNALTRAGIGKMTVSNVIGCGQQGGFEEHYRGAIVEVNLLDKVRIEIAVNDEYAEKAVDAICDSAYTGRIGDGKIFILPMEECIRVRTRERGAEAIG
ncbi:MAG: P-II family nitrogen regulator [Spirochaetota bacterium]